MCFPWKQKSYFCWILILIVQCIAAIFSAENIYFCDFSVEIGIGNPSFRISTDISFCAWLYSLIAYAFVVSVVNPLSQVYEDHGNMQQLKRTEGGPHRRGHSDWSGKPNRWLQSKRSLCRERDMLMDLFLSALVRWLGLNYHHPIGPELNRGFNPAFGPLHIITAHVA